MTARLRLRRRDVYLLPLTRRSARNKDLAPSNRENVCGLDVRFGVSSRSNLAPRQRALWASPLQRSFCDPVLVHGQRGLRPSRRDAQSRVNSSRFVAERLASLDRICAERWSLKQGGARFDQEKKSMVADKIDLEKNTL
jgi:hypothetical protein